jgi:hypothetical protein
VSDNKKLSNAFMDNNADVSEDFAEQQIVVATKKIKEIEEERSADEKLAAARQIVKDINSAYSSAIKYEKAKISFFLEKISQIQDGSINPTGNS